jgi:hypothetical protein
MFIYYHIIKDHIKIIMVKGDYFKKGFRQYAKF